MSDFEVVCVNDGSTDGTLKILCNYAAKDERVNIIDKRNEGYGAACNCGLEAAKGLWITIVEPDDWVEPLMYESMLDFASSLDEEVDIIKTPYWCIWMPDTKKQRKVNCSYRRKVKPDRQPFVVSDEPELLMHHPSIWSALYNARFLRENHICFNEYPGSGWADNPFLLATMVQAKGIAYLDEPYYCYRMDTPEKLAQFARQSTLMPLNRWHDMMDILDELNICDNQILRAHYYRGFTYLAGIIEEVPLEQEAVQEAAMHLVARMNAQLVLNDPNIAPATKKLFCRLRELPEPPYSIIQHIFSLVKQLFYSLRNTGIVFTFYRTMNYLTKKKKRAGGSFMGGDRRIDAKK